MTGFAVENLRDRRGKNVIDPDGAKIGEMEAVYVDTSTDAPAFLTVTVGMIGRHRLVFVPADGATVSPDAVRVRYDKKTVADAPSVDTDGELAAEDEAGVFDPLRPGRRHQRRAAPRAAMTRRPRGNTIGRRPSVGERPAARPGGSGAR